MIKNKKSILYLVLAIAFSFTVPSYADESVSEASDELSGDDSSTPVGIMTSFGSDSDFDIMSFMPTMPNLPDSLDTATFDLSQTLSSGDSNLSNAQQQSLADFLQRNSVEYALFGYFDVRSTIDKTLGGVSVSAPFAYDPGPQAIVAISSEAMAHSVSKRDDGGNELPTDLSIYEASTDITDDSFNHAVMGDWTVRDKTANAFVVQHNKFVVSKTRNAPVIPVTGFATYKGVAQGNYFYHTIQSVTNADGSETSKKIITAIPRSGTATLNVDFSTAAVYGDLTFSEVSARISEQGSKTLDSLTLPIYARVGASKVGQYSNNSNLFDFLGKSRLLKIGDSTHITGSFFGEDSSEIGGIFHHDVSGYDYMTGAFIAQNAGGTSASQPDGWTTPDAFKIRTTVWRGSLAKSAPGSSVAFTPTVVNVAPSAIDLANDNDIEKFINQELNIYSSSSLTITNLETTDLDPDEGDQFIDYNYLDWGYLEAGNIELGSTGYDTNLLGVKTEGGEEYTINMYYLSGVATPVNDMPKNVTATYNGNLHGSVVAGETSRTLTGTVELTADFGSEIISGNMAVNNLMSEGVQTELTATSVRISGNGFTGSLTESQGAISSGSINGLFYGSGAQNMGGSFDVTTNDNAVARGMFAAGQDGFRTDPASQ